MAQKGRKGTQQGSEGLLWYRVPFIHYNSLLDAPWAF